MSFTTEEEMEIKKIVYGFEDFKNELIKRFDNIDDKFDRKIDDLNKRIDINFKWLIGVILTTSIIHFIK